MKSRMIVFALLVGLALASHAFADEKKSGFAVIPFTFVGAPNDCGTPYPAGSNIVTSTWLTGLGLPDNGGQNTTAADLATNPNKKDPHTGLLLSKNGPTPDCSAAGADVTKVKGITLTEIGFDIRNGTHCGAGAPRFDVQASDGFHFLGGCSNGTPSPAPQDPLRWTRIRIDPSNPAQANPPIAAGATIQSISIIFDEGTDTVVFPPGSNGLADIDNIDINGVLVGSGPSNSGKPEGGKPHGEGGD
jgi:hypothetical protein